MFVAQKKKDVVVDGVTVTIRKLSARSLEKAFDVRQGHDMGRVAGLGAELIKAFQDPELAKKHEADVAKDPKSRYDRDTVLRSGIEKFTVPEDHTDEFTPKTVEEGVDALDEPAAAFIFQEIINFSVPREGEAEKG